MPIYRPRMHLVLRVPVVGAPPEVTRQDKNDDVYTLYVRVKSATLVANNFQNADELRCEVEWQDAGVDPRMLTNATAYFFMGEADEFGGDLVSDSEKNLRFVGVCTRPSRSMSASGQTVELEFLDYTTLFIKQKPIYAESVPPLTATLAQAWALICDHVGPRAAPYLPVKSQVAFLRDRLVYLNEQYPTPEAAAGRTDGMLHRVIGEGVAERIRKLSKVPVKPGVDAWALWQTCCQLLGMTSWIYLDRCIVANETNFRTEKAPPVMLWGHNIAELSEERDLNIAFRGVGIRSYDPLTHSTIEAVWPPIGDERVKHKRIRQGRGKNKQAPTVEAIGNVEERDWFDFKGITDPKLLEKKAKEVYRKRSRQEFSGTLVTHEMRAVTTDKSQFDLLNLKAGDNIVVGFEREHLEATFGKTDQEALRYLLDNTELNPEVARLVVASRAYLKSMENIFLVRQVRTNLAVEGDSGSFSIEVTYVNRYDIDGPALPGDEDDDATSAEATGV